MHLWPVSRIGRNNRFKLLICVLVLLLLLLVEEVNMGTGFIAAMNYYAKEVVIPIDVVRESNISVGIVVVVQNGNNKDQYQQAQDTVGCYAAHHGYQFHYVNVEENASLSTTCPHKDFMFQRHCVVAHLMSSWKESWLLFLDADMAVVNPNHLIEEYIPSDPNTHIVFYNRIFNHEVMAGSYLIRNSKISHDFLIHWSNYEFILPKSFHGSDNGAIHSVIVSFELPKLKNDREKCEKIWATSKRKDRMQFARWHSPLVDQVWNMSLCGTSKSFMNWRYKDSFIKSVDVIQKSLEETVKKIGRDFDSIKETL
ncbi:hypothetical protein OESDEN_05628 [Oesophagostomum dentatum]|uniref:Nucleotide-diphospho-sugar transferase domain-containing protein n=1 Tax=Oesophagostomum dentatum TaxID=61180 RepID=A0A0B1TF28_OESDE|nr:hypothetical protein OESDEN_05628 [Oesophagostomum dentatum]